MEFKKTGKHQSGPQAKNVSKNENMSKIQQDNDNTNKSSKRNTKQELHILRLRLWFSNEEIVLKEKMEQQVQQLQHRLKLEKYEDYGRETKAQQD